MSDFDDAVKELRALGIEIVQGQGEYHLFYRSRGRRDQGIALTGVTTRKCGLRTLRENFS